MKKFYLFIIVLFSFIANADCQVINNGEYFFDTDPGLGLGTPISITANDTVSINNIAINTAGLTNGYHFLYIRVKESNGTWSHCRRQRFYVFDNSPIVPVNDSVVLTQAEYWIDSLPVPGTGRLISVPAEDTLFYNDSIPGLQLDSGSHKVSVRVRDNKGNWSFTKTDNVRTEYYDLDISVINSPFIRISQKIKFNITIKNRGSKPIIDKYLMISSHIPFSAQFSIDSSFINNVDVRNISNTTSFTLNDAFHIVPIWIGPLAEKEEINFDVYLIFENLPITNSLDINYNIQGIENNDFSDFYVERRNLDFMNLSLLFQAQKESIFQLQDTLSLPHLEHFLIVDTLKNWYRNNEFLLHKPLFLNKLTKPILQSVYQDSVSIPLISIINRRIYNNLINSSYEEDYSYNFSNNAKRLDNVNNLRLTSETNDCICNSNLCIDPAFPPLPLGCYQITSTCKIRCYCKCLSNKYKRVNQPHEGYDIALIRKPICRDFEDYWYNDKTWVAAMFPGKVVWSGKQNNSSIIEVSILSTDNCGNKFVISYLHLSGKALPPIDTFLQAGDFVGYASNSGASKKKGENIHLHIEVHSNSREGSLINPSCILKDMYPIPSSAKSDLICIELDKGDNCTIETENVNCTSNSPGLGLTESRKCPSNYVEKSKCKKPIPIRSRDPNDKVGNEGYTSQRFIKSTEQLHYGIFFENVDTATAAAQVVTILDTLDLTKVDKHSFYLESITAGEMLVVLPDSVRLQNLDTIYKEKPVNGTYVHAQATFDTTTGIVKFVLTSLDTATLQPVTDVLAGFLPPDTTKFDGNGLVSYKIMPVATIPGGTVINNKAHIIFDNNPSIATGTWFNTIDGTKPSSQVSTLPSISYDSSFTVHWSGTDNESGIVAYDVYYKTSGESGYKKWINYTADTSAVFTGSYDSTYQFYSIGYDSVLNEEDAPLIFDAITLVKKPVEDSLCSGGSISFASGTPTGVTGYQWQADNGAGFTNLSNAAVYSGTVNDTLKLTAVPTSFYGYRYRCIINKNGTYDTSIVHVLHFVNRWTGTTSTAWENPANWSCNVVPDGNTDVIVNGIITNAPEISSNAICRSLFLNPGIPFKVNPNFSLMITH